MRPIYQMQRLVDVAASLRIARKAAFSERLPRKQLEALKRCSNKVSNDSSATQPCTRHGIGRGWPACSVPGSPFLWRRSHAWTSNR
jgi:hypothetical protein